jgi:hypothetical protein
MHLVKVMKLQIGVWHSQIITNNQNKSNQGCKDRACLVAYIKANQVHTCNTRVFGCLNMRLGDMPAWSIKHPSERPRGTIGASELRLSGHMEVMGG